MAALIAATLTASTLYFFVLPARDSGAPVSHEDGSGPLASTGDPSGYQSMFIENNEPTETFGYSLCVRDASVPATIDTISPLQAVGTGVTYLGGRVRYLQLALGDQDLISTHPFPPNVPGPLSDVIGAEVSWPCNEINSLYTELDLGLARQGNAGGGWLGFNIAYHAGGKKYVLILHDQLLLCGPSVTSWCHSAFPSPSPSAGAS